MLMRDTKPGYREVEAWKQRERRRDDTALEEQNRKQREIRVEDKDFRPQAQ